ncbi:MAG: VWA domain-containing protein, partial [Gammaproteobacteria bacterium]|nr:VWA domain-containing protein [Gammaproteobacteria bacterium]
MIEPGLNVDLPLQQLMLEVTVSDEYYSVVTQQTWFNSSDQAVEIHYTLPLPRNAILLELTGQIGEQQLVASVKGKERAEEEYENAMSEGNSAIHLQQLKDGLWGLSLGNLAAGEKLTLNYRWNHWNRWQGRQLRLYIPTTIAPKYGKSPLSDEFIPDIALNATIPLQCRLIIDSASGLVAGEWQSPSHPLRTEVQGYTFAEGAEPDRDIIFTFTAQQPPQNHLIAVTDDDYGYFQIMRWQIPAESPEQHPEPTGIDATLWLVVDCSGSMAGDSIAVAKTALRQIIEQLPEQQPVNMLAFGSSTRHFSQQPLQVSAAWRKAAIAWVDELDANLGGTDLQSALNLIFQQQQRQSSRIVLLTDGAVWKEESLLKQLKREPAQIYTIGIGSAVSESLVRALAEASGGECELVNPREDMVEIIKRQTYRACQPIITAQLTHSGFKQAPPKTTLPHFNQLWPQANKKQKLTLPLGEMVSVTHHLPDLPASWQLHLPKGQIVTLLQTETPITNRDL